MNKLEEQIREIIYHEQDVKKIMALFSQTLSDLSKEIEGMKHNNKNCDCGYRAFGVRRGRKVIYLCNHNQAIDAVLQLLAQKREGK